MDIELLIHNLLSNSKEHDRVRIFIKKIKIYFMTKLMDKDRDFHFYLSLLIYIFFYINIIIKCDINRYFFKEYLKSKMK